MKKYTLLAVFALFLLSCTVDEGKGLVVISNSSKKMVELKLQLSSKKTLSIGKGVKYDLWLFQPEVGTLSCTDAEQLLIASGYNDISGKNVYSDSGDCTFKPGYRYEIKMVNFFIQYGFRDYEAGNKLFVVVEPGIKVGGDSTDPDYLHYPGK